MGEIGESSDPPFEEAYKKLFDEFNYAPRLSSEVDEVIAVDERELPLIDLEELSRGEMAREECKNKIARASQEWGFFQVVNHGIPREILETMRKEEVKLFKRPFKEKAMADKEFNFSEGSYRWGSPSASRVRELSWSEAFHVQLSDIYADGGNHHLSSIMRQVAIPLYELGQKLAAILAEKVGSSPTYFQETCLLTHSYIRMNRYPPRPISFHSLGLMPHTDSDFLTILHQDDVPGLQLVKHRKWVSVKPNPDALVINIGDLFEAWSNGIYRSVEHRVVTNSTRERFSTAFFLCPSYDTVISSSFEPRLYRRFTFKEFKEQVREDVKKIGHKVGLSRFLVVTDHS
ncbi:gibberellin 2-beta-dioxygenase 8-like [Ipomoea triloba]|uniref:gibberellin 2-beta-dioxygenase 8-like n=1 Tax=Ipomoea triloba TaxID=35885 RepID=UPI00125DAD9A|nr:gibberellin 2-beta-dioxygenase 8-like [Ipomoea triloba]